MKARLPPAQSSVTLFRGDGASVVVPVRVAPLAFMQILAGVFPAPPDGATEEQVSEHRRVEILVRVGYGLTVEGSDYSPSMPFPDWKGATPESLTAYADALWKEMEEAGFSASDYIQLVSEIYAANSKKIEAINRPKG